MEEIIEEGRRYIDSGYHYIRLANKNRCLYFSNEKGESKSIDVSDLSEEVKQQIVKTLREYRDRIKREKPRHRKTEETSNENKSDENKKGEKKSKSESKLGESAEEFITTLLTQKYDKSRPILAQWISAHAEWNELLLNLGASAYRLYMLTRANGNVEEAMKIAMSHSNVEEVVKDFENYFTALLKVKDDAKALIELKEEVETLKQKVELLKQIARLIAKQRDYAIKERDYALRLLLLASNLMSRSQIEKMLYYCIVMYLTEELQSGQQ